MSMTPDLRKLLDIVVIAVVDEKMTHFSYKHSVGIPGVLDSWPHRNFLVHW